MKAFKPDQAIRRNRAQKKVAERERSIEEAKRKGDAKKIADRQAKLDAARSQLGVAEKPLFG